MGRLHALSSGAGSPMPSKVVGELLKQLDDLGIANDTIVLYSTDNGAEIALWPDGAMTPFAG